MDDDELRERLRAMPEPTATIDVDAVLADARRRRRPKVVGVAVASVAGCLAFLAPVVVPGLLGPDPVTATLQDQGAAEQAPAAPDGQSESSGGDAAEPGPSVLGGDESTTAAPLDAPVAACAATPVDDDLLLGYVDAGDGAATLTIQNLGTERVDLVVGDVGLGALVDGALVLTSDVDVESVADGIAVSLEPFASTSLDVPLLPISSACDVAGLPSGDGELLTIETVVVALSVDGVPLPQPVLGTGAAR